MKMEFSIMDVPAAGKWKRDCELTDFKLLPDIYIEFRKESDGSRWRIYFSDYFALKITSEEFTVHLSGQGVPEEGSFYIVRNSPWIANLHKINHLSFNSPNHYLFFFYDEVFEIISKELRIEKMDNPQPNSENNPRRTIPLYIKRMLNEHKINEVRIDHLGRPSQRFIGKNAEIVFNPQTRKILSVNPTSKRKAQKLAKELDK